MKALFYLLFLSILIVGCKKAPNNPVNNKPFLLITSVKVNAGNPTDTLARYDYEYDNNNRLIKIYQWSSPGKKTLFLDFSYDSDGNMASYIEYGNFGQENFALTFNNGLPVTATGTVAYANASYIQNFQHSNNNNTVIITENVDTTARDTLIYNNNNLVHQGQRTNSVFF